MGKEEFNLDRKVDVKTYDSLRKEGTFKGIYQGVDGKVRVTIGYERTEQSPSILEDVIEK